MIPPVPLDGTDLNYGCSKGKESGDPTVPAQGIVSGLRDKRILSVSGGLGPCALAVRCPVRYEKSCASKSAREVR